MFLIFDSHSHLENFVRKVVEDSAAEWLRFSFVVLLAVLLSTSESSVGHFVAGTTTTTTTPTSSEVRLSNATDATGWLAGWSGGFFAADGERRLWDFLYWAVINDIGAGAIALASPASEAIVRMCPAALARIKRLLGLGDGGD